MSSDPRLGLNRQWRKILAGAGGTAAVLLALGWQLTDLRKVDAVPSLSAGQRMDLGPYAITLAGWEFSDKLPDGSPAPEGRALWVRATVENLTSATRGDIGEHMRPGSTDSPPARAGDSAAFYLMRDRELQMQLHPALPEQMVLAIPAPRGGPAPPVTLFSAQWKARDALSGRSGWYDHKPAGTLTIREEAR